MDRIAVPVATRAPTGTTNAYVIGTDRAVLVDPAARSDAIETALSTRTLAHVLVTHHHPDHVGAVAAYARDYDATVWARIGREAAFEAATGVVPDRTFADGTTIPAGESSVEIVATPGHTPEHVAVATDDGLVCGDLAIATGSVAVGWPEGDMRAYYSSLRRCIARDPTRLSPGHGPVIEDPYQTCRRLLDHRLARERRIEAVVNDGLAEITEVTERAYEKDISGVSDLARATVRGHLEKLAVEGRIDWDGTRARPARS